MRGTPTPKPLKYKPKVSTRRSQLERERVEKEEQERQAERDAARGAPPVDRGARGFIRGRGGARGTLVAFTGERGREGAVSGPFGGGRVIADPTATRPRRKAQPGGRPSTTERKKRVSTAKPESAAKEDNVEQQAIKLESQDEAFSSSTDNEDSAEGPRVDIERINLISDEEDEADESGKGKHKWGEKPAWSLRPIRLDRMEHVDRPIGVSTDANLMASADLRRRAKDAQSQGDTLFVPQDSEHVTTRRQGRGKEKDVEFLRNERRWRGVYQDDEDNVQIKIEPGTDQVPEHLATDPIPHFLEGVATEGPTGPEQSELLPTPELRAEPKPKPKRRRPAHPKPVFQTKEDREEWERQEEDYHWMFEEFGTATLSNTEAEGGASSPQQQSNPSNDPRYAQLYVFQFPPIMPNLVDADDPPAATSAEGQATVQTQPINAPQPATAAETEEASTNETPPTFNSPQSYITAMTPSLPTGRVGKMRIRRSGRVEMDWGGVPFVMERGIERSFLQDVVMVNMPKGEEEHGKAVQLASVRANLVISPDWDKLF
ncbi:MAG: hypothetical protein M1833_001944 [Piccolia ochrophora]|nr:MAG: hypothetical protein M1833_001944 [Piccolia ochrophora]